MPKATNSANGTSEYFKLSCDNQTLIWLCHSDTNCNKNDKLLSMNSLRIRGTIGVPQTNTCHSLSSLQIPACSVSMTKSASGSILTIHHSSDRKVKYQTPGHIMSNNQQSNEPFSQILQPPLSNVDDFFYHYQGSNAYMYIFASELLLHVLAYHISNQFDRSFVHSKRIYLRNLFIETYFVADGNVARYEKVSCGGTCWAQHSFQSLSDALGEIHPPSIDAAALEEDATKLYLIKDDMLYLYDASCTTSCTFTFDKCLDFTVNDPGHPFYAATGSHVAAPPAGVHALTVLDTYVLAFVGDELYSYMRGSQQWNNPGKFHCI